MMDLYLRPWTSALSFWAVVAEAQATMPLRLLHAVNRGQRRAAERPAPDEAGERAVPDEAVGRAGAVEVASPAGPAAEDPVSPESPAEAPSALLVAPEAPADPVVAAVAAVVADLAPETEVHAAPLADLVAGPAAAVATSKRARRAPSGAPRRRSGTGTRP